MNSKKHEFYGVDLKTEWLVGLLSGAVFIIIWVSLVVFYYWFNQLDSILRIPVYIFFGAMFLGLTIFIIFLRKLGRRFKRKFIFALKKDCIEIIINNNQYTIDTANELRNLMYVGTQEMRYVKIKTTKGSYKIRVGTSFLAPFSKEKDIKSIDDMLDDIDVILNSNNFTIQKGGKTSPVFGYLYKNKNLCKQKNTNFTE